MSLGKLSATATLGLCLAFLPFATMAQNADTTMEDEPVGLFVPIVADCIDAPDEQTCGEVRAVVTECAADLTESDCDVLFEESADIFADPDRMEEAQLALTETSDAIAEMQFDSPDSPIDEAIEATRANSERTMLRGDENLNSHSSPPTVTDE